MNALVAYLEKRITLSGTHIVGLFSGVSMSMWGVWLLSPFETFKAFGGIYSLMGRYASEPVWGIAFVISGIILLTGILSRNRYTIMLGATLVMLGRIFITTLTGLYSNWTASGVPDHAIWALMTLICLWGALRSES